MDIRIRQRDTSDCGAACLASVAAHFRLELPLSVIRQWAGTDRKGTSAWGLIKAAEKMGMSAKGVKAMADALAEVPLPAIAHINRNGRLMHYVVIYRIQRNYLEVMDPGTGRMEKLTREDFLKEWTGVLILLAPSGNFVPRKEKVSNFKRFRYLLYPNRYVLLQALFGAIIFTILGLSVSVYIQKITDYVLIGGNRNLLNLMSIAMLVILAFQVFIGTMQSLLIMKTGQLIDAQLILGYYKHLLNMPQRFFDTMLTGEVVSRINDAVKIRAFINDTLINVIVNLFILFFAFLLMFIYSWKLALIILIIIPLYAVLYIITDRLNKKRERKIMEQSADLESQLIESISSVRTIKQLSIEDFVKLKTEAKFTNLLYSAYKSGLNTIFSGNTSLLISRLFTVIMLWLGSLFVINREITPGELMSFYALTGYLTGPVSGLISMNKVFQNATIAADRLFEIMDLEVESSDSLMEVSARDAGDIEFKSVSFSYGTRNDVFDNFNLLLKSGEVTAIIGESGSGKTTVVHLLQKLYPVNNGSIYLGKKNIAHIDSQSLRQMLGIVPQTVDIFSGTILSNIAVGQFQPDISKVVSVCNQLGLDTFLDQLPDGLQTWLGEHGANLSGGQKQRIAIARALYRNPEILIMDEATSSLDAEAEAIVQNVIKQFRAEGKTVILIAHRLSSAVHADKVVVLKDGKLMEEGTPQQLWQRKGIYYSMWQKQLPANFSGIEKPDAHG